MHMPKDTHNETTANEHKAGTASTVCQPNTSSSLSLTNEVSRCLSNKCLPSLAWLKLPGKEGGTARLLVRDAATAHPNVALRQLSCKNVQRLFYLM
mmetsp:Transcript_14057/g.44249  ORF Transcript_14057/g.44249 Transcript_14057/m.44249 type:complete len:96 (+) Transcript_14057:470-757(+)